MLPVSESVQNGKMEDARIILDQLSGVFILNTLKMTLIDNNSAILYSRINEIRKEADYDMQHAWVRAGINGYSFNYEGNDLGNFDSKGFDLTGGYTLLKSTDYIAGAFVQYNHKNFKQYDAQGSLSGIDFGGYSSYDLPVSGEKVSFKGALSFGISSIDTERKAPLGTLRYDETVDISLQTSQARFNVYAIKYILNAEYVLKQNLGKNKLEVTPFLDFQGGFAFNEPISEKEGGDIDLDIKEDSYSRLEGTIGTKIGKTKEKYLWNLSVGFGYILLGNNSVFNVQVRSLSDDGNMKIYPMQENPFFVSLGGYGQYNIRPNVNAFIDANVRIGSDVLGYYAGIGASYKFKIAHRTEKEKAESKRKEAPVPKLPESDNSFDDEDTETIIVQELTSATIKGSIFPKDGYTLSSKAKRYIKDLAKRISAYRKNYSEAEIIVSGFAGSDENEARTLSSDRALIVAKELAKYKLKVFYRGNNPVPIEINTAENTRRVEIKMTVKKK
jgi:outer membrane protein OmpA-like peptidoglycan-associated protein